MLRTKSLAGILLIVTIIFAQVGTVFAAPAAQGTTSIIGTVKDVVVEADPSGGEPTVLVTVLDETTNTTQTVRISVDTAAGLGLLMTDPATGVPLLDPTTQLPIVDESSYDQEVTIDPTTVIVDQVSPEEPVNPVAAVLAKFFGVDAGTINAYHEDGYGFGVIAQALWIANGLKENNPNVDAGMILQAKRDKDFSSFILPDGTTPTNWGQFKNAATGKDKKNLGIIVSGHADPLDGTTTVNSQDHGNGKDKNKDKGNDKNKSKKP